MRSRLALSHGVYVTTCRLFYLMCLGHPYTVRASAYAERASVYAYTVTRVLRKSGTRVYLGPPQMAGQCVG
jgi:hypothetical protein